MAMTVLITLTTAGIDSGPFNLYSDVDGYVSAFASGIGRASLLAGYSSAVVPDGTTTIRILSAGNCTNYIDLAVVATTTTTTSGIPTTTTTSTSFTTTTTTTGIQYNLALGSPVCRLNNCGDNLVCAVRYAVNVSNAPLGSYIAIVQNSGNATVSMFGTSPINAQVQYSEPNATGTANFTLLLKNSGGITLTSATVTLSHETFWEFLSVCPVATTTTTPPYFAIYLSNSTPSSACAGTPPQTFPLALYLATSPAVIGDIVYNNSGLSNPFVGDTSWYSRNPYLSYKINGSGFITDIDSCSPPT